MLGLSQSLAAQSICLLLAQGGVSAPINSLPFGPVKLIFLLGWVYLSLYLVQRVEDSPLVPGQYRSILHVVTLFVGPLVFLVLVLIDAKNSKEPGRKAIRSLPSSSGPRAPSRISGTGAAERPNPSPRCGCSIRWAPS